MDLYFNELSFKNENNINNTSIIAIIEVYKELLKYQITTCRIAHDDNIKLFQKIDSIPNSINIKNLYFSFFKSPYESESVEKNQDEYFKHDWTYEGENCIGFALAHLLNSASLSIYSTDWNTPSIHILKDKDSINIRNICTKDHVDIHIPQMQGDSEIELLQCHLQPPDKKIHLRDDHGKDVLFNFSKRLVYCPYLIEVVNSLPYNSHNRKFIKRVCENGLIEIVLPWTDAGYGIVIRTTGRSIRETEKIAKIIEEEFGYI